VLGRSIEMQLRTRVSMGSLFAATAVAATVLAWRAQQAQPVAPALAVTPIPVATVASDTAAPGQDSDTAGQGAAAPEPGAAQDSIVGSDAEGNGDGDEAPGPDAPSAILDKLDLAWLPKGYVRDAGADKTQGLAQLVEAWAASDSDEPRIEYRKGVVFARSTEDRGDDGPYPRSAAPQGQRVCGDASVWLRTALRERLANDVLTCDRNVCMYGGSEYAPDGYLVFRPVTIDGEPTWALDAWVEVYRAALGPETADRNQAEVVRALKAQVGTSCAGEPAGAY
jgi:hypothetical protein